MILMRSLVPLILLLLPSVASAQDGEVVVWGNDFYRQVSHAPNGRFLQVSGGWWHSLALRANGSIASWGNDGLGQVSDTPTGNDFAKVC